MSRLTQLWLTLPGPTLLPLTPTPPAPPRWAPMIPDPLLERPTHWPKRGRDRVSVTFRARLGFEGRSCHLMRRLPLPLLIPLPRPSIAGGVGLFGGQGFGDLPPDTPAPRPNAAAPARQSHLAGSGVEHRGAANREGTVGLRVFQGDEKPRSAKATLGGGGGEVGPLADEDVKGAGRAHFHGRHRAAVTNNIFG